MTDSTPAVAAQGPVPRSGYYRWTICALLFFATTVNYLDRSVLSLLGPEIKDMFVVNLAKAPLVPGDFPSLQAPQAELARKEVLAYYAREAKARASVALSADAKTVQDKYKKDSELKFGRVNLSFQAAYAVGLLVAGRIMDWTGTRLGLSLSVLLWSLAGMAHALARGFTGFVTARFALGLTEAGNFPAAIKTVAEWFPKKERALATGIFNAGSNIGAILSPAIVPWLALNYGWKTAFIATGAAGLVWLAFWIPLYHPPQRHPRLKPAELAYIQSDPPDPAVKVPWKALIPYRQTWAFSIGKLMTDPIWWFFLFWTPSFFKEQFGYGLDRISGPMIAIYLAADIGSVAGGWFSGNLIKRGWSVNRARKTAMLVCALCVVPVWYAGVTTSPWMAVAVISLALGAHQGWSANLFTLVSDTFPRYAVGSVVGIGGMAGALGGMFMSEVVGQKLKLSQNYLPMFIAASGMYLATWVILYLLNPKLEAAKLEVGPKA